MSTNSQSPPLKTDVLGRVHITAKNREALLDAYEASSMTGMKFAAAHGVKYQQRALVEGAGAGPEWWLWLSGGQGRAGIRGQ